MNGSWSVLQKNVVNAATGIVKFGVASAQALATWKKIQDRTWTSAPQEVKDRFEVWEDTMYVVHLDQHRNSWVDKELVNVVSQKEIAQLMMHKYDTWRMAHGTAPFLLSAGLAVPFFPFWLGNDTWIPSTFNATPAETLQWRKAQDMYRYKYAPALLAQERWFLEMHVPFKPDAGEIWDELFEKNDVRKDPARMHRLQAGYDKILPFYRIRRKQARNMARTMGIPTFPMFQKINVQTRILHYWELVWNEDYMVLKGNLHQQMSDDELQDYAWRRFLAPYDKNLNREQLLRRVEDYQQFLGKDFANDGKTPNIFICLAYCASYYNDPAFLDRDIAELEQDDFQHLASWGKDAFMKRLEFENGPLRDQVEAHSIKSLEERQKRLEA